MNTSLAQCNMVKQQLRTGNVLKNNILSLYQSLPREYFVPRNYKQFAYSDLQIPIGNNERMLTPLEESTILQALDLDGSESVLEVGTGLGYLTALLSQSCKHVTSIDCHKEFTLAAEANLKRFNIDNVSLITGDGHRGYMDKAPYDVIVITGGLPALDDIFRPQLMKGGKLFAIIGVGSAMQGALYTLNEDDNWEKTILFETSVPMLSAAKEDTRFNF